MMRTPASRIFVLCLMGVLLLSTAIIAGIYWHIYGYAKMFGDFATFREAGVHIASHELKAVYDIDNVSRAFASGSLKDFSFFLNPPTGLFIVYPLAFIASLPGLILWTCIQLALMWCVLRSPYMQRLFTPKVQAGINTNALLLVTFLAFSLQNILYGQLAVFCTVLFLLVLSLRKTHPVLAGAVLGIFSFKPQLGLLLPVLLIAEGNWKTLGVAVLTALAMAGLSCALWGGALWQDYAAMLSLRSRFMAQPHDLLFIMSTSVYAGARNLGASAEAAFIVQILIGLASLIAIWPVLRGKEESYKILMLSMATYLVTPYSLIYDMTLAALPCAWLLRRAEADLASRTELIALLFLVLMPLAALLLQIFHIPYSVIAIGLGLIVARGLALREQQDNNR